MLEWGEEVDCFCLCGTESVFFLASLFSSPDVHIFHIGAGSKIVFQNRQVVVTSLYCRYSESTPARSLDCWSSCNLWGKMSEDEMEDDRGMVMEVECVVCTQNLGGKLVLIFIIAGISICMVVVVVVGVMFFGECSLSVMEVECLGVGFCVWRI